MVTPQVVIDENKCRGCGLCERNCPRGCITIPGDKYSSGGYLLPAFGNPDLCNTCGFCTWMCPHFAIEVFLDLDED